MPEITIHLLCLVELHQPGIVRLTSALDAYTQPIYTVTIEPINIMIADNLWLRTVEAILNTCTYGFSVNSVYDI